MEYRSLFILFCLKVTLSYDQGSLLVGNHSWDARSVTLKANVILAIPIFTSTGLFIDMFCTWGHEGTEAACVSNPRFLYNTHGLTLFVEQNLLRHEGRKREEYVLRRESGLLQNMKSRKKEILFQGSAWVLKSKS